MKFYYQLLSKQHRLIYHTLKSAIENYTSECTFYDLSLTAEQIGDIITSILMDYPDYYWTKGNFSTYTDSFSVPPCLRVRIHYLFDNKQCQKLDIQIQNSINNCLNYIGQTPNPSKVIFSLCKWIYQNITYAFSPDTDQTIYSVFHQKKSVCMGISRAAALILRLYDIDSIVTLGKFLGKYPHSWLIVHLNGSYFHLDITLGYPCFDTLWNASHPSVGHAAERYCILRNDSWLSATHTLSNKYPYPSCRRLF